MGGPEEVMGGPLEVMGGSLGGSGGSLGGDGGSLGGGPSLQNLSIFLSKIIKNLNKSRKS